MLKRLLRASLVLTALSLTGPLGCSGGTPKTLEPTEVPGDGVELKYALSPGAVYEGEISRRESVQSSFGTMKRSLNFGVELEVLEVDKRGRAKVAATVKNLDIRWALPPDSPISVNELVDSATARLDGARIPFTVTEEGKVKDVPPMPEGLRPEEAAMLETVVDGLTSAFFLVPEKRLSSGESWKDQDTRGRKGKLGRFREISNTTTFDGLFKDTERQDLVVAKLTIEGETNEITTTKAGGHAVDYTSKTTALFAVDGGYLTVLEGIDNKFDGPQTTTTKFKATWSRSAGAATRPPANTPETQAIADPCDPDYVGPDDCVPPGAETQAITDPCDPDYVGPDDCEPSESETDSDAAEASESASETTSETATETATETDGQ